MPEDTKPVTDENGEPIVSDDDKGSANEDDTGAKKLTIEEIKANIQNGTAVSQDDLKRLEDNIRDTAVKSHQKIADKKAKKEAEEKKKEEDEKKRQSDIDKLTGEDKITAQQEEKERELKEREYKAEQREYRAKVKEIPGYSGLPDGVCFTCEDDVEDFVDFLKNLKPAEKEAIKKPVMPNGKTTPENQSEKQKLKEQSMKRLAKYVPSKILNLTKKE